MLVQLFKYQKGWSMIKFSIISDKNMKNAFWFIRGVFSKLLHINWWLHEFWAQGFGRKETEPRESERNEFERHRHLSARNLSAPYTYQRKMSAFFLSYKSSEKKVTWKKILLHEKNCLLHEEKRFCFLKKILLYEEGKRIVTGIILWLDEIVT